MLKNDIEKTLQAHKPVPPEGFAERTDYKVMTLMQKQKEQAPAKKKSRYRKPVLALAVALVLCFVTAASRDLIIRPDTIRARETATPLVTALSEGKGEETGAGTEVLSGDEIDALEVNFPGIAGELRPVNLSCEKQGIRMEVISALKKENEAWIVYSLQDLEGDRVTRLTGSYDDIFGTGEEGGFSCYLSYNEAEHKLTAVYYTGPINQELPEDASYPFRVEDVSNARQEKLDILPYLKEYGKASEGVEMPDDAIVYSQSKVLDSTEPLNICLAKDFYLTGIGWIDNQLHVQIQDRQQERITIGPATVSPMVIGVAALYAEKPEKEVTTEQAIWSSAGEGYRDMSEFILGIRPEEADKIRLEAWTHETTDVVRDTWEVQIPLAGILMTTAEPAAREEEAEMIREIMDAHVEEVAYDELTPIGLSTEKQGFRMEMVSGCRKGDYVYFLLNMLDLEGKYSGYECYPVFEEIATEDNGSFGHCAMLRNNQAKNKTTWLYRKNLSQTIPADNNTVRAGFTQFFFSKHNSYDLLPMLKEYGRTEEGLTPPDSTGYTVGDGKPSENKLYVLNYEKSLDIHLGGNVFLSAVGWIGNQLHVQFQEKPWSMMTEYPDVPQDDYRMTVNCNVQDKPSEETTVYGSPMIWTDPDEGTSWEEYVFNCTPEDLDRMELRAFETQSAGDLQADWTVEVPLDLLPDLNAAAETAPAA